MAEDPDTDVMDAEPMPSFQRPPSSRSPTRPAAVGSGSALNDPFHEDAHSDTYQRRKKQQLPRNHQLGQFSFAPATQTTVVTTTTTTTTQFPPLLLKAPKGLQEPDPRLYPLATSPTPQVIKDLQFKLHGRPTIFREADDTQEAISTLNRQQQQLRDGRGIIRSTLRSRGEHETPTFQPPRTRRSRRGRDGVPLRTSERVKQAAASEGSRDNTKPAAASENRVAAVRSTPGPKDALSLNRSSRLQFMQTSTPITPPVTTQKADGLSSENLMAPRLGPSTVSAQPFITPEMDSREFAQTLSPNTEGTGASRLQARSRESFSSSEEQEMAASGLGPDTRSGNRPAAHPRPRPAALDTAAGQDASLPSPSLSPVTAAANLQSRRNYFEEQEPPGPSVAPMQNLSPNSESDSWTALPSDADDVARSAPAPTADGEARQASMMDIPDMLDSFEAMPTEMKTYVMFQLLRRCPKSVLHFVADHVNPALKCDFLGLLPPELAQNVIAHLDLRSLCRASQVSKRWRQIIDTDEKAWKELFDADGYETSPAELQTAIQHGWGWQSGSTPEEPEQDLGGSPSSSRDVSERLQSPASVAEPSPLSATGPEASNAGTRRVSKRKIASKTRSISRKTQKKGDTATADVARYDEASLERHAASSEGPYAAAQAALAAVPFPAIGLPTLRTLHLYKSLYRRHHLIRAHWTDAHVPPRHIAFKAHHRHVVTCLQFDADKILTGSDDTNINVYDTRSGALRARLDGHEGGVWALQYHGNTLVSGSTDRSVRVWDIPRGVCTHVFQGHTSTVRCLVILMPTEVGRDSHGRPIVMPKEPIIITGSRDSTLRVWKLPNGPEREAAAVAAAAAHPPLASLRRSGGGRTHGPANAGLSVSLLGNPMVPAQIGSTNNNAATAATSNGTDANAGAGESPFFLRALLGHTQSVRAIAAHGDTLVSGSYDHTVRVWRLSTGETAHVLRGHTQKVYSVVLDPARRRCISGSMDNLVKIWSLDTGAALHTLDGHTSLVGLLDLQRGRLVSAAADSTLRVWDPATGACQSVLTAHTGAITCFQHDGRQVVSGSDRCLKMWDVRSGAFVRDLLSGLSGVWQVRFDERRCVAAVQRNNLTYIEVLDFGAARDGVTASNRGRRVVVDVNGIELESDEHPEAAEATDELIV